MRQVLLGRTGIEVPAISLGTWSYGGENTSGPVSVGWSGHDPVAAEAALLRCHEVGITHWDSADVYGDGRSESLIGQVWGSVPREEIFLASKVGWDKGEFAHYYHPQQIRARIERSLRNLKTEQIDLFYLHHCDFGPQDDYLDDALAVLREARDAGQIRFIGLSDWDPAKVLRYADRVDPDVIQPYRNVAADTYVSSGLKAWVDAREVGVAFFSPIRHGLLLGRLEEPREFPEGDFRQNVPGFADPELLATLRTKAEALRARFPERPEPVLSALVNALLSDTPSGCVLLGLRNPAQVAAAVAASCPLSAEEAEFVRELYAEVSV